MVVVLKNGGEDVGESGMGPEDRTADDEAEVGGVLLNKGEAAVAMGKEKDLNESAKGFGLGRDKSEVEFESSEVGLFGGGAMPGADVVLAGGEEGSGGSEGLASAKLGGGG